MSTGLLLRSSGLAKYSKTQTGLPSCPVIMSSNVALIYSLYSNCVVLEFLALFAFHLFSPLHYLTWLLTTVILLLQLGVFSLLWSAFPTFYGYFPILELLPLFFLCSEKGGVCWKIPIILFGTLVPVALLADDDYRINLSPVSPARLLMKKGHGLLWMLILNLLNQLLLRQLIGSLLLVNRPRLLYPVRSLLFQGQSRLGLPVGHQEVSIRLCNWQLLLWLFRALSARFRFRPLIRLSLRRNCL